MAADPLKATTPIHRRTFLQAGASSALGLSLAGLTAARAAGRAEAPGGGQARSCIVLYMLGGPPQQETFDPKPDAPGTARSLLRPIATSVPGVRFCDGLPRLARNAHRLAVIRSTYHAGNALFHGAGVHYNLTGWPNVPREGEPFLDRRDYPCLGSVLRQLRGDRRLPAAVQLPDWITQDGPGREWAGQHAGFLGRKYDPVVLAYAREAAVPGSLPAAFVPRADVGADRLQRRMSLLRDAGREGGGEATRVKKEWAACQAQALDVLASPQAWKALSLDAESRPFATATATTTSAQLRLVARRLVEAGVRVVTVVFGGWDTHSDHLEQTRDRLLPPLDRAFSALLEDLDSRGLLAETLVVWTGEFGRTPWTNANPAPGRDHWARVYSTALAGGGIQGGRVYGSSDTLAGEPKDDPVPVRDFVSTVYHALGVGPDAQVMDMLGRQHFIVPGDPLVKLF
ncbi:MAG: DUF1501 domain-containing protein [Gemmataceae bacterium]